MKFYKQHRNSYWSDSKVFSWMLRERPKFILKTPDDFREFEKYIDNTPKLERFIDNLQDIVLYPSDLIYSVKIYLKNSKGNSHVLDGGLNKGEWHDLVYRIPVCLFGELEKFIEQEKGVETHKWEMKLTYDEDWGVLTDHPKYGALTPQALAAIEQDEIYKWWKANKNSERSEIYEQEETDMLIRLIKIRNSLWT